jgi:hypothetical protein
MCATDTQTTVIQRLTDAGGQVSYGDFISRQETEISDLSDLIERQIVKAVWNDVDNIFVLAIPDFDTVI